MASVGSERRLAFLKALVAAAWADGELSGGEIRTISEYLRGFNITGEEYAELQPYMTRPLPREEALELIEGQIALLESTGERGALVAAIKDLFLADGPALHPAEKDLLEQLGRLTGAAASAQVFISRLRALWAASAVTPAPAERASDPARDELIEQFLQSRLFEHFRRRIALARAKGDRGDIEEVASTDLYRVVLWAGLLSSVARVDDDFCPAEQDELIGLLGTVASDVPLPDLVVVVQTYVEGGAEGLDLRSLLREFLQIASGQELDRLLDSLFMIAAADGRLSKEEVAVIQQIAIGAGFPPSAFVEALKRCQERMQRGWS